MPDIEHREYVRARIWLPIRLHTEAGDAVAVTYDVSEKGVLILTTSALAVGTAVTMTFDVPGEPGRTLTTTGRVIHEAANVADPGGLWRHRVGVALDELMGEFRTVIEALVEASPVSSSPASSRPVSSRK